MKSNILQVNSFDGSVIRDTEVYTVTDNHNIDSMTVSKTCLHPGYHTKGHSHPQEEVYNFFSGSGKIQLGDELFDVSPGIVVTIPSGVFHKVYNVYNDEDLVFICVFQKYQREC